MNIEWRQIVSDLGNIGFSAACISGAVVGYSLYTQKKVENPDVYVKIYLACKLLNKGVSDFQNRNFKTETADISNQKMINVAKVITSFVITNVIGALFSILFFGENTTESKKEAFANNLKGFMLFNAAIGIPQYLIHLTGSKIVEVAYSYLFKSGSANQPKN